VGGISVAVAVGLSVFVAVGATVAVTSIADVEVDGAAVGVGAAQAVKTRENKMTRSKFLFIK
jgi:hypothetical protein